MPPVPQSTPAREIWTIPTGTAARVGGTGAEGSRVLEWCALELTRDKGFDGWTMGDLAVGGRVARGSHPRRAGVRGAGRGRHGGLGGRLRRPDRAHRADEELSRVWSFAPDDCGHRPA